MRDFQTKSNVGALPDSNSATKFGGGEATSLRTEAKTAVERAGLTLAPQDGTGEDTTQLAQGMMINGMAASTFQAGGTANAITLTPVTGTTGLKLPPDYSTLDGMQISFFAGFNNTGPTTVSIGQTAGTQFGVKKILDEAGADLVGGEILANGRTDLIYDAAADGGSGAAILRSAAAVTPPVFTESFISTEQTITAGGPLTIAHGLSGSPAFIQALIICKVANGNYLVGDELIVNNNIQAGVSAARGLSIIPDATNISIRFGSDANTFGLLDKISGAISSITNTSWKLVVRAYR